MSADNGIYVLETKDGFRVIHAQAIDNIYWSPEDDFGGFNREEVKDYFGESKVYENETLALGEAKRLFDEIMSDCGVCEYGICFIPGLEKFDFPS